MGIRQLEENRHGFCLYLWQTWMNGSAFSDAAYNVASASFQNLDWLDITLHSYLHRWGDVQGDQHYSALENRLENDPFIHVPTLVLHGLNDPCNAPASSSYRDTWFKAGYEWHGIESCGHFPQREQPGIVAASLSRFLSSQALTN